MNIRVRPGRPGDLGGIRAIYDHYVKTSHVTFDLEPPSAEDRIRWLAGFAETGPHRLLVALAGPGEVLGYACSGPFRAKPAYDTTVETTVYCAPQATHRGTGSRLYADLLAALDDEPLHLAVAGIALPNPDSVALHERFGFTHAGTIPEAGRKFDRYWDVAFYVRRLGRA